MLPTLSLQVLDNGSDEEQLRDIQQGLANFSNPNIRLVHLNQTAGLARGFNLLFYDMCGDYKYLLTLEDDWKARGDAEWSVPALEVSMRLLDGDTSMLGVWLRDFGVLESIHKYARWKPQTLSLSDRQLTLNVTHMGCPSEDKSWPRWGVYTNGASLMHMSRLKVLGQQKQTATDRGGEADFATLACERGLHSALICPDGGSGCLTFGGNFAQYKSLFEHTGATRVASERDIRFNANAELSVQTKENETLQDVAHIEVPVDFLYTSNCRVVGQLVQCDRPQSGAAVNKGSGVSFDITPVVFEADGDSRQDCVTGWTFIGLLLSAVGVFSVAQVYLYRSSRTHPDKTKGGATHVYESV